MTSIDYHPLYDGHGNAVMFFDRDGLPISFEQFAEYTRNAFYRRVKLSMVNDHIVSTLWLGLAHGVRNGDPLIFETAVFDVNEGPRQLLCYRYANLAEALAGHEHACLDVSQFETTQVGA